MVALTQSIDDKMLFDKNVLKYVDNDNVRCNGKNCINMNCHCIKRISLLLKVHHKNININTCSDSTRNIMIMIHDIFGKYYDIISILNDYIHIVKYHDNILEDITKYIINLIHIQCNLQNCGCIKRNYRNRVYDKIDPNDHDPNRDLTELMNDIIDIIHCYLIHTFDIGFKLTKTEKQLISMEQEEDEDDDGYKYEIIIKKYISG